MRLNPADVDEALHCQHAGVRDSLAACWKVIPAGLCARNASGEHAYPRQCAEASRGQVAVHLITDPERRDAVAHGRDSAGDVRADNRHLRPEDAMQHASHTATGLERISESQSLMEAACTRTRT